MELIDALKKASHKVWDELEPVTGIKQYREEGLTTMALRELAKSKCDAIVNIFESPKHGKSSEKFLGYDFEIWIGTNNKYVRYIIQAKNQSNGYTLNSEYNIDTTQLVRLERYALTQKLTAIPLYAFYKHLTEDDATLETYYNSASEYDKKALGITLSTTAKVKQHLNINFRDLHQFERRFDKWFPFYFHDPDSVFYYHQILNTTLPFHELASFSIEQVEFINQRYREMVRRGRLHFFFFFFPFFPFGDNKYLIPIHNISMEEILKHAFEGDIKFSENEDKIFSDLVPTSDFQGRALIIIDSQK